MTTEALPTPTLVRLEYRTPNGWVIGHKGIALLHPGRYVERLAEKGKIGRAIALDDQLQPTGQVWGGAPGCGLCAGDHQEGRCLI